MADMDMAAMMGFAGFGKKPKQKQLDPKRFEKNRREDVSLKLSAIEKGCPLTLLLLHGNM